MFAYLFGSDTTDVMAERLRVLRLRNAAHNNRAPDPAYVHVAPVPLTNAYVMGTHARWAPTDNMRVFGTLGQAGGNVLPCLMRAVDMAPFTANAVANSTVGPEGLYIADVLCSLRTGSAAAKVQQVIAECLVPNWPNDRCLTPALAQAEMARLLDNGASLADQGWFADVVMELQRKRQMQAMAAPAVAAPAVGGPAVVPPDFHLVHNVNGVAMWNMLVRDWQGNPAVQDKLDFLVYCMQGLGDRQRARAMYPVFLLILAFVSRGTISSDKLERLKREMKDVLGALLDMLKPEDVRLTWDNFSSCILDGDAARVFARWEAYFTGNALIRLRVMISQAKGAGLTSLDIINRAIHVHPHFAWFAIRRLYPEEWAAAQAATIAVGGNRYYGYRADLGVVKATLYKRLAWACQMLLVANGEDNLAKYRGFTKDESKKEVLLHLIAAYKCTMVSCDLKTPVDVAENTDISDYVDLVAQYPGNQA